jgi:hypothetical protein
VNTKKGDFAINGLAPMPPELEQKQQFIQLVESIDYARMGI